MTDDRPLGGRGGYNINWDEVDENTNPFGPGKLFGGSKLSSSPPVPSAIPAPAAPPPSEYNPQGHSEDPPSNNAEPTKVGKSDEIAPEPKPTVAESGDAKSIPTKNKLNAKGPRPAPPMRTVSKTNSNEVMQKKEPEISAAKSENQIPNIMDIPPPDGFVPEEPPVGNQMLRGHSRRASNSSAATFDLASGNRSPLPEAEPEHPLSVDEELATLRADKEHLTTVVADMQRCISEYELSLRQLAEEKTRAEDSAKESVIDIIAERDQAIEEITTIEKAFGDLHRRFEKSKQIIEGFKTNEETLKKTAQEYQDQLKRQEQKYQALKTHAEQQLTKVAEETERAKRANEDEVTRLRAAIKRSELRIHSLETQLQQKIQENTELTKICDELLNKYGDK
ncbi:hypothetical protein Aperf_G00000028844 [Anoplocephala perfoliata]